MLQAKQVGTGFGVSALGLGFRVWVQDLGVFMFIWRAGGRGGGYRKLKKRQGLFELKKGACHPGFDKVLFIFKRC